MTTKRTKPENEDTMREHYDLSKLQVRQLGSGWGGRNPFAPARRNSARNPAETFVVELTAQEAQAIAEIVDLLGVETFDFADVTGISETKAKRLLSKARQALAKIGAA